MLTTLLDDFERNGRSCILDDLGINELSADKLKVATKKLNLSAEKQAEIVAATQKVINVLRDSSISKADKNVLKKKIVRLLIDWGVDPLVVSKPIDHEAAARMLATAAVAIE